MSDLTPITREEALLDGQDLTPITRKELFIKRIYDKTTKIPEVKTREEWFLKKAGESIPDIDIEQLSVTQNGIYSESGKAYSPVIVEVPQITTESLSVTDNGTYTAPSGKAYNEVNVNLPLDDKTITSNGTYKASDDSLKGYDEVVVDVPLPENAYLLKEIEDVEIATFTDGTDTPLNKLEVGIEPIQSGSGDPSPTNIRPISGWDEVNVFNMDDINDKEFFDGLLNGTFNLVDLGSLSWSSVTLDNGVAFYASIPTAKYGQTAKSICADYGYNPSASKSTAAAIYNGLNDREYCFYANLARVLFRDDRYEDVTSFTNAVNGIYLIYELDTPTTPTITPSDLNDLYSEFGINGHTYTIQLGDTYYGGKLDVVNGVLTKTHEFIASYNGETLPSTWISDRDVYASGTTPTTGAEVVYELATPTTIQLTPTQVRSLLGNNNIFADTGNVLECEYFGK